MGGAGARATVAPPSAAGPISQVEDPYLIGDLLGMGIRGAGGVLGVSGGVPGAAASGGADIVAQLAELGLGSRDEFNPWEVGANAATGAIPFGKAGSLVGSIFKGSLHGGGNAAAVDAAQQVYDTQPGYDVGRTVRAGLTGMAFGAGGGAVAAGAQRVARRFGGARPTGATAGGRESYRQSRGYDPAPPPDPNAPLPVPGAPASPDYKNARRPVPTTPAATWTPDDAHPILRDGREGQPAIRTSPAGENAWEADRLRMATDHMAEAGRHSSPKGPIPPDDPLSVLGLGVERNNPLEGLETSGNRGMGTQTDVRGVKRIPSAGDGWSYSGSNREIEPPTPMPYQIEAEPAPRGMLDFLDPEDGIQINGSGATKASTEALNRATSFRNQGVQQFRIGRDGSRELQIDPDQIADPWTTIGAGERVERIYPDGRVEVVAGETPRATLNDAGPEIKALMAPDADPIGGGFDLGGGDGPIDLDAILGSVPKKHFVPAELVTAHRNILQRMAEKPGTGNTTGDLVAASRQWQATDPSRLWNIERQAMKKARTRVGDRMDPIDTAATPRNPTTVDQLHPNWPKTPGDGADLSGQAGAIDPELLAQLGLHLGSGAAAAGAAGYLSDENVRERNMIGAGLLGAMAPFAWKASASNPALKAVQQSRYFGMLSGFSPQVKNVLGGTGSTGIKAAEEALTGNFSGAKDLLAGVIDPEMLSDIGEGWRAAGRATPDTIDASRWGTTQGVLGIPSRAMHALDEGFTSGLKRGGLSEDEARITLGTNQPLSEWGKGFVKFARHPINSTAIPFARTATNLVERGLEHTPLIGELPGVKGMRQSPWQNRAARQVLGGAAMAGGAFGSQYIPDAIEPFTTAAMGPVAVPYLVGKGLDEAWDERGDRFSHLATKPFDVLRQASPLASDAYDYDPGRLLSSWVPGAVRDVGTLGSQLGLLDDPRSFNTSRSVFDPTIAKVPGLNSSLLPKKRRRAVRRY